jgi:hypothetical protein
LAHAGNLFVIGENEEVRRLRGEGFYAEDGFLKEGFGGNQFEEVFGFGFAAEGPEAFAAAPGHDEH